MQRRTFCGITGGGVLFSLFPGLYAVGSALAKEKPEVSAVEVAQDFLRQLKARPMENLERIRLRYNLSTSALSLDIKVVGEVELKKNGSGYKASAQIVDSGGAGLTAAKIIGIIPGVRSPNLEYSLESVLEYRGNGFRPRMMLTRDRKNEKTGRIVFERDGVRSTKKKVEGLYEDPLSKFFNYVLVEGTNELSQQEIVSVNTKDEIKIARFETRKELFFEDGKIFEYRMEIMKGAISDILKGDIYLSLIRDANRNVVIPTTAIATDLKGLKVFSKLSHAEVEYSA